MDLSVIIHIRLVQVGQPLGEYPFFAEQYCSTRDLFREDLAYLVEIK
jgi:hypothetical protein